MVYDEFIKLFNEKFGSNRPGDIANELSVSPQVVNNWKIRDQVPYKYVKLLRDTSKIHAADYNLINVIDSFKYKEESNEQNIEHIFKSINNYLNVLFFRKKILFVWFLIFVTISFLNYKLTQPKYSASTNILPVNNNSNNQSNVSNIASQLGFNLKSGNIEFDLSSTAMIPDIVNSNRLYSSLLRKEFKSKNDVNKETLFKILTNENITESKVDKPVYRKALAILSQNIFVSRKSSQSALLNITCYANDPFIARDMVNQIIISLKTLLNEFRVGRLMQKEAFIRNRLQSALTELTKAEENIKNFREKNRNINTSPSLLLQSERLLREVDVKKEIYITLKNQLEVIQVEMVGKNDFFQVLDYPQLPLIPDGVGLGTQILLSVFIALVLGLINIFLLENKDKLKILFSLSD